MFSDVKWHVRSVMDGFYKERKLLALILIWIVFFSYGSCRGLYDSYLQFYHVKISAADALIIFQGQVHFGIMLFPIFIFLVMKSGRDSLNVQRLMRYGDRKKMFRKQIWEGFGYAVIITVVMLAVETVFARIMTGSFINWDQIDSLYYSRTGTGDEVGFLVILVMIFGMYLVKFVQVLMLMEFLLWSPRYMPALWIVLVLLAGISSWKFDGYYQIFSVQTVSWNSPVRMGGAFLLGLFVILAEYAVEARFIRKKDLYGEMNAGE